MNLYSHQMADSQLFNLIPKTPAIDADIFYQLSTAGVFITYFSTLQILTFLNINFYIRTSSSILSNALLAS